MSSDARTTGLHKPLFPSTTLPHVFGESLDESIATFFDPGDSNTLISDATAEKQHRYVLLFEILVRNRAQQANETTVRYMFGVVVEL